MLYRNQQKGIVAGVAKGLSDTFGISVILIRLFFILSFFTFGIGFILYAYLMVVLPDKDQPRFDFNNR